MENKKPWYYIDGIDQLDTPALVIFPERVKKNIKTAIEMAGDVNRLRPHVKTHKSPAVTELMKAAGIQKFKCATIAEAEMLGMCNAVDVLLAYQPGGPKLQRFAELVKRYPHTQFSCLVDNKESALEQSTQFEKNHLQIPVFIDLNLGMNRTGIDPGAEAIELYKYCASLGGITISGLHAYDGHIRNADINARTIECDTAFSGVAKMKAEIIRCGLEAPLIIAGGSHTFPIHCKRNEVECSPGTFVYWDKGNSDYCPEQDFDVAALLISRIVSLPGINKICIDLGHKSVAAENPLVNRVFFLNAPETIAVSQSEEHLVLETKDSAVYKVGDILYGIPVHVCPTIALYESAFTVEQGRVTGEWDTPARARKITV